MIASTTTLSSDQWNTIDARVKRVDEDRWLSSRYAPDAERRKLIALYAFAYELARVRTVVSEPGLGAIRFQWWRDALDEMAKGLAPRQHDVVRAIAETALPHDRLGQLIDGYEASFESQDRSIEPEGRLILLACELLDVERTSNWCEPAQRLGTIFATSRRLPPDHGHTIPSLETLKIPTSLRPAVAHCSLARAYISGKNLSPVYKRWVVFKTILRGKV